MAGGFLQTIYVVIKIIIYACAHIGVVSVEEQDLLVSVWTPKPGKALSVSARDACVRSHDRNVACAA